MPVFTKEVHLVWMVGFANNYQFDKDGNCYNIKTNNQIKRTMVGYTEGYCVNSKFYSLKRLRKHLIKITNEEIPF